ncbi:Dynamitin [Cryptosporidium felis]|nr:Dynamitin [Cryptosporidium felis]
MINGELVKTNYLSLIQALSNNDKVKISKLKGITLSSEDMNGSLVRIKSEVSEIENTIKTYETLEKANSKDASSLSMGILGDTKFLLSEIEEIKTNLNNLIEKQQSLESSANSLDALKQQKFSTQDLLEELSNCVNSINNNTQVDDSEKPNKEIEVSIECLKSCPENNLDIKNLLDLERRVYEIESRIGIDRLSAMPYSDVQTAINNISQRLSLLDTNRLEGIFRRVQALSTSIEQLNKKRKDLNDSLFNETDSMNITKLYDIIQKWKHTGATLPFALERLKLLKILHQDIATIGSRLAVMESQQVEVDKTLSACKSSFNKLSSSIEQICKSLQ